MSVTLTQQANDRNTRDGGAATGLRVDAEAGPGGSHLSVGLSPSLAVVHVRCLLRRDTFSGQGVIASLDDQAARPVLAIEYHSDPQQIRLLDGSAASLAESALSQAPWHHVEVGYDSGSGLATLWVDGVEAGQAGVPSPIDPLGRCRVGLPAKHHEAVGGFELDEWVITDAYVGVDTWSPGSSDLADPARWLVVFNHTSAQSVAFAEAYRVRRGPPSGHLLGLDLPTTERITTPQFNALLGGVDAYLDANGLAQRVHGVVLSYGVPGFVDDGDGEPVEPVAALLQSPATPPQPTVNPLYADALPPRPSPGELAGLRLVASLDAPTLTDALAMLDRADALGQTQPLPTGDGTLWFDPYLSDAASAQPPTQQLVNWGLGDDRQALRLPIAWSRDPASGDTSFVAFDVVERDGFFFGWSQASPPPGFFAEPAGSRVACFQFNIAENQADTVRDASANNWITAPIEAGYAAAIASSRFTSYDHVPAARPFFEALRRGWTLAEAFLLSRRIVGTGFFMVGDPLLTVRLPRAGWDVYGPASPADGHPPSPSERLPITQTTWSPPVDASDPAAMRRFTVQRHGEDELELANTAVVRAERTEAGWIGASASLAWPPATAWRPSRVEGGLELFALWRTAPGAEVIDAVEVDRKDENFALTPESSVPVEATADRAVVTVPPPAMRSRYRVRLLVAGETRAASAWSRWVEPTPAPDHTLTLLETA